MELIIGNKYNRKEVHDYFSPKSNFTQGAGTWGLQGIVKIDPNKGDYVLFVTYGREQSGFKFKEGISEEGYFEWQSQPSQKIQDRVIQELINSKNNHIYLFLRENKFEDYKYIGELTYVSHEPNLECPVHFIWKIKELKNVLYINDSIRNLNLTPRTFNCLMRKKCTTIGSFLDLKESSFAKMRSIGNKTAKEIIDKQQEIKQKYNLIERQEKLSISEIVEETSTQNASIITNEIEERVLGVNCCDFSPVEEIGLSLRELNALKKNGVETFIQLVTLSDEKILAFKNCWEDTQKEIIKHRDEIIRNNQDLQFKLLKSGIEKISPENYGLFLEDFFSKGLIEVLSQLEIVYIGEFCKNYNKKEIIDSVDFFKDYQEILLLEKPIFNIINEKFINLMKYPLWSETNFNENWERDIYILECEEEGKTFVETSSIFNITRTAVMQIINKMIKAFSFKGREISRLCEIYLKSLLKQNKFFFGSDVERILNNKSLLFLLKTVTRHHSSQLKYYDEYDVFSFYDSWVDDCERVISLLPKFIPLNKEKYYLNYIKNEFDKVGFVLNEEEILRILSVNYSNKQGFFAKERISLIERYRFVLEEYYKKGIKLYDDKEIEKFLIYYKNFFGDNEKNLNTKSVSARIFSFCLMLDRGFYGLKEYFIKDNINLGFIRQYIINSDEMFFFAKELFFLFKSKLKKMGINNRYYLYSLLKEFYGEEFFFKKDYISKTEGSINLGEKILNFIISQKGIVGKDEIINKFPMLEGLPLQNYLLNKKILNYFGKYVYLDNLNLTNDEIGEIKRILDNLVSDGKIHHTDDLFSIMLIKQNPILEKCFIEYQYTLFSLVEVLFEEEYEFKRPYIAKKGTIIPSEYERIKEFVSVYDEISINEIIEKSAKMGIRVNSILDLVNDFEDYVFENEEKIIKTSKMFVDECDAIRAIDIIERMTANRKFLSSEMLSSYVMFPEGYDWNQWILYSLINKYSDKVVAITDSNVFRRRSGCVTAKVIFVDKNTGVTSYEGIVPYLKEKGYVEQKLVDFLNENRL